MTVAPYYSDPMATLYLGDCLEIAPQLAGVTCIVSDPPYGIGFPHGAPSRTRSKRRTSRGVGVAKADVGLGFPPMVGDDRPFDPTPWLGYPRVALFGANHYAHLLPPSAGWIVWDKRVGMASTDQSDCELCWTNVGGSARIVRKLWNGGGSYRSEFGARGAWVTHSDQPHPTVKPQVVMRFVLSRVALPTDLVLDPYAGSGSTLVAAKAMGIRSIGIEIEERYCEVAARRLSQEALGLEVPA